ncbi:hypothetical protein C8R43DRAFT_1106929 [Mycena crocata]|nr:hypothetical protein C8R43DRAFT_1106929 [Mycena crocata]
MVSQILHIERSISNLPWRLRPVARAAIAGSQKDIQRLLNFTQTGPESQSCFLLPVFNVHLDPGKIPTAGQLDAILTSDDPLIHLMDNAVSSLVYLSAKPIQHPGVEWAEAATLWHRVWPWIQFLDSHSTCLPPLRCSETTLCAMFAAILGTLRQDAEAGEDIAQTTGVHTTIARAWKLLLNEPERTRHESLGFVSKFLSYSPVDGYPLDTMEELCDGAGGSMSNLASLTVQHLNRYATRRDNERDLAYVHLSGVVLFAPKNKKNIPFQAALRSHGIVEAITRVACALANELRSSDTVFPDTVFPLILDYLNWQFQSARRAHRFILDAIHAGMLHLIIPCGTRPACDKDLSLLLLSITPYTVYYSVLAAIEPALVEINLKCGKIHRRRDLRRCAGCAGAYYCSKECQTADWIAGHKESCRCNAHRQNTPEHLSTRDRSFLRALVNYDYKSTQLDILHAEFNFLRDFPADEPCLSFDYRAGPAQISVTRQSALNMGALFRDETRRQEASGRRLQLHFVELPNGTRLLPMHANSTVLAEGLRRLRTGVDSEGEDGRDSIPTHAQIQERISALLDVAETHLVQIH